MRAAILAGGKGTRMSGLFPDLPKSMIPVAGKPLLQRQIESLVAQGTRDVTLIVGCKAEAVRAHFGDGERFGANVGYIVEDSPLGTGGALSLLPREDTLVLLGDVYCDVDFARFAKFHRERRADVTLFVHPNSHPQDSDIVVVDDGGRVVAWKSKNDSRRGEFRNLVNAGLYIFSAEALPTGEASRRDLEHDIIIPQLSKGEVYAYRSVEYVKDMGTPDRLRIVERDVSSGIAAARSLRADRCAVFIDRDGTLNEKNGFITNRDQIRLIPGAAKAVRMLNESPFLAICVTNQPVVARGDVTFEGLDEIHARLDVLLGRERAYLDDLLFCPHHTDKGFDGEIEGLKFNCACRKPNPGLLHEAAARHNIDLSSSYMIGDGTVDVAAGRAAGCRTIGLRTGEALSDGKHAVEPDAVCDDLLAAAKLILAGKAI
jgi:D-glycero-D-manno-heptose 1,7-bisphosphate phosphatase